MAQPAIQIDEVVRRFGPVTAVDGVSFDVRSGEIFGLLGHNGAGKTTLIRLITGLLQVHGGGIRTLGMDPTVSGSEVRARTGVLTEYPALDPFLSPFENLAVHANINGMDRQDGAARAQILLEQLQLQEHRDVPSHTLSAGLKQRVALARALVHEPELLLLDEPTSNLDPLAARSVRDLVLELSRSRGRTVLLSTHNLIEAQYLCDRIAVIREGRLLALGSLDEMRAGLSVGAVEIAIDPEDGLQLVHALRRLTAVETTQLAQPGSFEVRVPHERVPEIVRAIVAAGARIHAVRPETPTLEDVYVSLHEPEAAHTTSPIFEASP